MKHAKSSKSQRLEPLLALSAGQPLESSMRTVLEPLFSHDLSRIRIHAGDAARDLSHALGARAFTVGSEIGLRNAADLTTEVLPHELAHAVQFERSGSRAPQQRISQPGDAAELEAHRVGAAVMAGGQAQVAAEPSAAVSLWPEWLGSAGSAFTGLFGGGAVPPQQAVAPLAVSTPAVTTSVTSASAVSSVGTVSSMGTASSVGATSSADAATPPAPINQQAMDQAAGALFRAMDGIGTDEDAIHAALNGRSPAEAAAIRAAYLAHYGSNLDADLGDELSGTELEAAQAAMTGDPVQAAATALINAADGVGTNEEVIQRTLRGITDPAQRILVEAEFARRNHGQSLQTMLGDELSDSDLTISSALRTGDTAGADAAALDAAMHDTTLGIDFGTDEDRVNRILEGSDAPGLAGVTDRRERERIQDAHRANVMAQYNARAAPGHSLEADLSDELSGAELTVSQRLSAGDRIGASAARMAVAAEGIGTDEDGIYAQLEGRTGPERQALIDRFNLDHGNQFGSFNAMVADEMSGLELQRGSGAHLTEDGRLDPVFALQFAQDGVGTDEEMIRGALQDPTRPGHLLSQDQIRDLQTRYADATGESLTGTLDSELSGRDSHDISQLMLGEPANVQERLARAEADWQFERGTGAGIMGGFTDVFYDSGNQLDRQHNQLEDMQARLETASPEERAALEAQAMRTLGFQQTDIGNFRAAQDSVSDKTAQGAALVAAAAFTIATGGAGSPALVGVMGMGTTGAAVAGGALAAGAGGLATMAAHRAIGGDSYGVEAFGTDAAMMGAGMVSGGLMSSPIFQGAAGGGTSMLQNGLRSGMGVAEGGAAEFVLERGTQALVSTAIGGTTQASLNESVWRGPGNGAAIFGASMGTSFAGNLASGMAGGHSGSFAEGRFGSGYGGAFARGALGDVGGGAASALVNPATYSGRWEDMALRVGTSAATSTAQGGLSGVGTLYGSRAYPRGSAAPSSSGPVPNEPPGPPPPPGEAAELTPNQPPPGGGGEVSSVAPHSSDSEALISQAIAEQTAGLPPTGTQPLEPADFAAPPANAQVTEAEYALTGRRNEGSDLVIHEFGRPGVDSLGDFDVDAAVSQLDAPGRGAIADTYVEAPAGRDVRAADGSVRPETGLQDTEIRMNPDPTRIQYHENMDFAGVTTARVASLEEVNISPQMTDRRAELGIGSPETVVATGGLPAAGGRVVPTDGGLSHDVPLYGPGSPNVGQPRPLEVRYHSDNPQLAATMPDAQSANNPTIQINTNNGRYLHPELGFIPMHSPDIGPAHLPTGGRDRGSSGLGELPGLTAGTPSPPEPLEAVLQPQAQQPLPNVELPAVLGQTDAALDLPNPRAMPSNPEQAAQMRASGESYSNGEIREWYTAQTSPEVIEQHLQRFAEAGLSLAEQAAELQQIRHNARITARGMMGDSAEVAILQRRDLEKFGNPDGPSLDQLVEKAVLGGMRGDEVWDSIIGSSQRTDAATNAKFGVQGVASQSGDVAPVGAPAAAQPRAPQRELTEEQRAHVTELMTQLRSTRQPGESE